LAEIVVAAVAVNVAVVALEATSTDDGTVSRVVLLASATVDPPAGAGCVSVTVQVLAALCPRLAGLQLSELTSTGARRLIAAVPELPLSVAVTVAV
jgi:hypothetical protein